MLLKLFPLDTSATLEIPLSIRNGSKLQNSPEARLTCHKVYIPKAVAASFLLSAHRKVPNPLFLVRSFIPSGISTCTLAASGT